uniref:Type I restriction modification DNA specificity domain-containing protein n=1 Tax=Curvibacter symbiont subsp. Hydra magnipapillata TaxID=667019 RepID=C9YAL6_CURXX|nr:hypothetical protein Csp_A11670 [Curvibacter putative symbiont of Hydra magnipapillata]
MSLPQSWTTAPLGKLCEKLSDGSHNPPKAQETGMPMLSARNINDRKITFDEFRLISPEEFAEEDRRTRVSSGDVLLTIVGAIGRTAVVPQGAPQFTLQRSVAVLKPIKSDSRYISYALEAPALQKYLQDNAKGTAQKGIYLKALAGVEIPVAPEPEQKRIADKLDTVLTRVDAVNTRLARVAPLLKRFRQSVLAAATSGRLTEDWRNGSIPEVKEWSEKALSEVCRTITDGEHISPPLAPHGVPLVSAKDVREWGVDFSDTKFVSEEFADASRKRCGPICGDVLVVSRGATVGRTCLVKSKEKFCLMGSVLLFQPTATLIKSEFLAHVLASPLGLEQLTKASGATAQAAIYIRDAKGLKIRLPSIEEQTEIVRRVETLFAFADRLEARLAQAQAAATRLTPALLAKAFSGELVPQDPNDEPAAELLRRLAQAPATASPRKGRKAAGAAV